MRKGTPRYKYWKREGFPLWLQEQMAERGLNALKLSQALGATHTMVNRWMTGANQPSPQTLQALARLFVLPEVEVLLAAGYLTQRPQDDPRLLRLHDKLAQIDLTQDRFLIIDALLTSMMNAVNPEEEFPTERPSTLVSLQIDQDAPPAFDGEAEGLLRFSEGISGVTASLEPPGEAMKATPLADWIYRLRFYLGLTQKDFAVKMGTTISTVHLWERGKHQPTGGTLKFLTHIAEQADFELPPEVSLGRGPMRGK